MKRQMRHFDITAPPAQARALEENPRAFQQANGRFPPSQFFKEAGVAVVVCLGLGVLANILVTILGVQ
jgi:hypothetical protein